MKMVKSLLLGTMAGLVAMASAQAANLPDKAMSVQYVKMSSMYGAGFYYIPGTDSNLKVAYFVSYDGGTEFGKPIKDKVLIYRAYMPGVGSAFLLGRERPKPLIVAEGNSGISRYIPMIGTEVNAGGPACSLKPEYRVSYHGGTGKSDPFHHVEYDHGA